MTIDFKKEFPALQHQTYLNTPMVGLIPKAVLDFKEAQNRLLWNSGGAYWAQTQDMAGQVREKIAEVFHGDPQYVALFPAFSYGINAILEGLKKDTRILLLEQDYPSINLAVEARDFRISYVPLEGDLENRIRDHFKTYRPEVFIYSIVQYLNGIKIDLSFLRELKQEFPETLFIGDGTQYLGAERFNFKESAFDIVGASAYKWIGAGFGNGFFMFKPEVEDRLSPKYVGASSTMGKYKSRGLQFIGKFEANHLNMADIGAIKVALEFHEKVGFEALEKRVKTLSQRIKNGLMEQGLLEPVVQRRKVHSPIFNITGDDTLFAELMKAKIICAQRGAGIRIGIHYYNDDRDVDHFLKVLSNLRGR